jgi:hypothetical protein
LAVHTLNRLFSWNELYLLHKKLQSEIDVFAKGAFFPKTRKLFYGPLTVGNRARARAASDPARFLGAGGRGGRSRAGERGARAGPGRAGRGGRAGSRGAGAGSGSRARPAGTTNHVHRVRYTPQHSAANRQGTRTCFIKKTYGRISCIYIYICRPELVPD